jgi:hypothetical protein
VACSPPSPEQQVRFLQNIQRLLGEGLFVPSYKFALIRAMTDLAAWIKRSFGQVFALGAARVHRRRLTAAGFAASPIRQ